MRYLIMLNIPLIIMFPILIGCSAKEQPCDPGLLVKGNTSFAFTLYHHLKEPGQNLLFSPYSLSTALAMTYGGARGDTAAQIAETLCFPEKNDTLHTAFHQLAAGLSERKKQDHVELFIANSLWPDKTHPFRKEYLSLIQKQYGVSITPVDYVSHRDEARKKINGWVENVTQDRIKDLILEKHLTPETALVLVNAIYFKGEWASRFDPEATREMAFYANSQDKKIVPMMYQKSSFRYGNLESLQMLEIPYAGNELSMVFFLPGEKNTLATLEKNMSADKIHDWISLLKETQVKVYLPRFTLNWGTTELNNALVSLGIRDAFTAKADFSGMDGTRELYISYVLHKSFLEVNEEGSEAAASSAVIMAKKGRPRVPEFRADRPFMFVIRDNITGSILFMGRLMDPDLE